jgi:3-oxoacyl-[acyl-carrier-protein] synthase-3
MLRTRFLGTGHYVPEHVVTNAMLSERMDTSDTWIQQRTGIVERRHVDFSQGPMGASDLACRASQRALQAAGVAPEDIDLIVYATLSPDRQFPGDGVVLQAKLGVRPGVPALDIRNQCSGFLYGLATADAFVRLGQYRRVLLVGSELHSSGLDYSDRGRDVAVLFGDGAGAVVLGPAAAPDAAAKGQSVGGILAVHLHADGHHAEDLRLDFPSSAQSPRVDLETLRDGDQFPKMNGKNVFKHAVTRMPEVVETTLAAQGLTVADVDLFICHQANLRISEMVQKRLGLKDSQVFNNIMHYGNTTAASIPLAIDEAVSHGRLKRGDLLCCAAFGAGFTWGAALVRW